MKNNLTRRKFIQAGAMATGGLLASRAIQLEANRMVLQRKKSLRAIPSDSE